MAKPKHKRRPTMAAGRAFDFRDGKLHLRRAKATPAFLESVAKKLRTGEYAHEQTTGDVETYALAEWSPMLRSKPKLGEVPLKVIENAIIGAAVSRDWKVYRDATEEYARRFKGGEVTTGSGEPLDPGTARAEFVRAMQYLELRIARRGGANAVEIQRAMSDLRVNKGRVITTGARMRAH